jgi:hypothetical protein
MRKPDPHEEPTSALEPLVTDGATAELTTPMAATTDRCPTCDARMAPDQRYCINCGERRTGGGLRDALPKTPVAAAVPPRKRGGGLTTSSSTNLIAGVGVLLLALGVGVLIGRTGHSSAKSTTPQVVTVQSAGTSGTAAATTAAAAGASTAAAKHASTHKHAKTTASHSTAAQKAAAKNGVKLPPPVVKVGGKCQPGAKGCQGGKFTGNFFGGG